MQIAEGYIVSGLLGIAGYEAMLEPRVVGAHDWWTAPCVAVLLTEPDKADSL